MVEKFQIIGIAQLKEMVRIFKTVQRIIAPELQNSQTVEATETIQGDQRV
jgi:hypothetical protein